MASKTEASPLSLDEVQAMVKATLAEAKAEAEKIVAEAKKTVHKGVGMTDEERAAHEAYMNELVEVKLFRDSNKYKDDVFVSVNGESIAIRRGERVKIKRKFAEVLENSQHQDYETAELIASKVRESEKTLRAAGL